MNSGVRHGGATSTDGRQRAISIVAVVTIIASSLTLILVNPTRVFAAGAVNFEAGIVGGEGTVVPGEVVQFHLTFQCAGLQSACGPTTITDVLDEAFDPTTEAFSVQVDEAAGWRWSLDGRTLTIAHDAFPEGAQSEAFVSVQVRDDLAEATTITHQAKLVQGADDDQDTFTSSVTTLVTGVRTLAYTATVEKLDPASDDPPVGGEATYRARLCADTAVANYDLDDAALSVWYPAGAVLVAADGEATDAGDQLSWKIGPVRLSELYAQSAADEPVCFDRLFTLRYPADTFGDGRVDRVEILANATVRPTGPGEAVSLDKDDIRHGFGEATVGFWAKKTADGVIARGVPQPYELHWGTWGNVGADGGVLVDEIPDGVTVIKVDAGTWTPGWLQAHIEYSDDGGTSWNRLGTVAGDNRGEDVRSQWAIHDNSLPVTTITHVRWVFHDTRGGEAVERLPAGVEAKTPASIWVLVPDDAADATLENCISLTWKGGEDLRCVNSEIIDPTPRLRLWKDASTSSAEPGQEIEFTLRLYNDGSGPAVDPVIVDVLPPELEFVAWTGFHTSGDDALTPATAPNLMTATGDGGGTVLRWAWSEHVDRGAFGLAGAPAEPNDAELGRWRSAYVTFTARVAAGTPAGVVVNEAAGLAEGRPTCAVDERLDLGPATDVEDLDGDRDTAEPACRVTAEIKVFTAAALETRTWVGGQPELGAVPTSGEPGSPCPDDDGFTRHPCAAQAVPGGDARYRIELRNVGNIGLSDVVVVDVLPHRGDTGVAEVAASTGRGSEWAPKLTGPVVPANAAAVDAGFTVLYSLSFDACRPTAARSATPSSWQGTCDNAWLGADEVGDWGKVRAFRIAAPAEHVLSPGARLVYDVAVRVPTDAPLGSIAWNSLVHRAVDAEKGTDLGAVESGKVALVVPDRAAVPEPSGYRLGNLVWLDADNDGRAGAGESGISGIEIVLVADTDDEPGPSRGDSEVARTVTAGDGTYDFTGLGAGVYYVVIPDGQATLAGLVSSERGEEPNADNDGDNNDNGVVDVRSVATGLAHNVRVVLYSGSDDGENRFEIVLEDALVASGFDPAVTAGVGNGTRTEWRVLTDRFLDVALRQGAVGAAQINGIEVLDGDGAALARINVGGPELAAIDGGPAWSADTAAVPSEWATSPSDNTVQGSTLTGTPAVPRGVFTSCRSGASMTYRIDLGGDPGPGVSGLASSIVTLGTPSGDPTEPTNETRRFDDATDDDAGLWPDGRSNVSVDFGFFGLRIGNQVWLDDGGDDQRDDAHADASEHGINGVSVELWLDDGDRRFDPGADLRLDRTVTRGDGNYWFSVQADTGYFVAIPAGQTGQRLADGLGGPLSLTDLSSSSGRIVQTDNEDDGAPVAGHQAVSALVVVAAGAEPTGEVDGTAGGGDAEAAANAATTTIADASSNLAIDFGFAKVPTYRVGNLVWEDLDNDGIAEVGEPGLAGVLVELDAIVDGDASFVARTSTDSDGRYRFEGLAAGHYAVRIPRDQTAAADPEALIGLHPSVETSAAIDDGIDNDNDGSASEAGLRTAAFALGRGTGGEPITETRRADDATDDDTGLFPDDQSDYTVDLAFFRGTRLGNQVWFDGGPGDATDNGVIDLSEPGIADVRVELWRDDDGDDIFDPGLDELVDATTTVENGNYWLTAPPGREGAFFVAIPADRNASSGDPLHDLQTSSGSTRAGDNRDDGRHGPLGYLAVSAPLPVVPGTAPLRESDSDSAGPRDAEAAANAVTPFADANSDLEIDFGFTPKPRYRLGNLVFDDLDHSGFADPGEPGIADVEVRLYQDNDGVVGVSGGDTPVATTFTAEDGTYAFTDLHAGIYYLAVPAGQVALTAMRSATADESVAPDDDRDHDDNGVAARRRVDGAPEDATYSGLVTIGGTDSNVEPAGETDRLDGSGSAEDGTVVDRRSNLTVDFGYYRLALGDLVWFDADDDGLVDVGEEPIPGVTVSLWVDADGDGRADAASPARLDVTDDVGRYRFSALEDDQTYIVQIDAANFAEGRPLIGLAPSSPPPADPADDVDDDNNGAEADGAVAAAPVQVSVGDEPNENGTAQLSVDFGFVGLSLGNRVWFDSDFDGDQDEDEPGIAGVPLELWPVGGADQPVGREPVARAVTDEDGLYLFSGLESGRYLVQVADTAFDDGGPLAGHASSPDGASGPDRDDDGVETDGGVASAIVTLVAGAAPLGEAPDNGALNLPDRNEDLTVDFGFHSMSIGNRVWLDIIDENGVMDAGEPPVGGVAVDLLDAEAGTPLATTTTDGGGNYLFTGLRPGDYVVRIARSNFAAGGRLEGYISTGANGAEAPDPDDDVDDDDNGDAVASGAVEAGPVTLTAGAEPLDDSDDDLPVELLVNGSFETPALTSPVGASSAITGWRADGDGARVELWRSGLLGVAATDGGQLVELNGVAADAIHQDTITEAGTILTWRLDHRGRINTDRMQVAFSAPGAPPVVVADFSSPAGSWQTHSGTYLVPAGQTETRMWLIPLDPGPIGNLVDHVSLTTTAPQAPHNASDDRNTNLTVDFGFITKRSLSLGNRVWFDLDDSGTADRGEPGVAGAAVGLYVDADGDGTADHPTPIQTTTTDEDGYYIFIGLPEGGYVAAVESTNFEQGRPLTGWHSSTGSGSLDVDIDDDGIDPETAGGEVWSGSVELTFFDEPRTGVEVDKPSGGIGFDIPDDANANMLVDFGFHQLAVGNLVWLDRNNDGERDAGEPGIADVLVTLYRDDDGDGLTDDFPVAESITDESGYYLFGGLSAGTYVVAVEFTNFAPGRPLEGHASSTGVHPVAAGEDSVDDGHDPVTDRTVVSDAFVLAAATEPAAEADDPYGQSFDRNVDLTVDFGFHPLAEIGDRVWLDLDRNGVQDRYENGVPDVVVGLVGRDGIVVARTATDDDGLYLFTDVVPGTYAIDFDLDTIPRGHAVTTRNATGDRMLDSDPATDTGRTDATDLVPGESDRTWDMGIHPAKVDLAMKKELLSGAVPDGELVVYRLTVSNLGPDPDRGPIEVTDTMPSYLTYESYSGTGWKCAAGKPGTVSCITDRPLGPGDSLPAIEVSARASVTEGVKVTNGAEVLGSTDEVDDENNDDEVTNEGEGSTTMRELAFTGADSLRLGAFAVLLLALGAFFMTLGTWRRRFA